MPTSPRDTRADFADFYPLQTRWMDNDVYGHMNNVVHYSLFDTAVNGWLMQKGVLDPLTNATFGLVVETGCQYFAEMRFPDTVTAGLRITKLGNSSVTFQVGLFRNDEENVSALGHFTHVYVDRETRRPAPIEAERRAVMSQLLRDQS
jgi:acyl-CoA thioester hydrolase